MNAKHLAAILVVWGVLVSAAATIAVLAHRGLP